MKHEQEDTRGELRGVALILTNPAGEILTLEEFETKIHVGKQAGMRSIPMETSYPGEPDESAVERLIAEELPGIEKQTQGPVLRIGRYQIVAGAWVTLYKAEVIHTILPEKIGEGVGNYKWVAPEEALTFWLRQGAEEMIADFQQGKENAVVQTTCKSPHRF